MKSLTVFAYNVPDILKEISKKGTDSDIAIHSRKDGDTIMTFLEPIRYPDKVSSLTDSIYPADIAVVNGNEINREFGEAVVALDLMRKTQCYFFVEAYTKRHTKRKLVINTPIQEYKFFSGSPMELVELLRNEPQVRPQDGTLLVVDHFFKVKSVGTVALAFVLRGTVRKHHKLQASQIDKEIQVRSIQMHDVDQEEAGPGSRVGLALKNIDSDDMERGMFFSEAPFKYVTEINAEIIPHRAVRQLPEGEFEVFVSDMMRYQRGTYSEGKIIMDKPLVVVGDELVLSNPNISPRIFGKIKVS